MNFKGVNSLQDDKSSMYKVNLSLSTSGNIDHSLQEDKSLYKVSQGLSNSGILRPAELDIDKLVSVVRRYSFIYDHTDVRHTHRDIVNDAWQHISKEMHTTQFYAKAKWTNLRSNFTREMRKIRSDKRRSTGPPSSRWRYFDTLSFLCKYVAQKPSDGNRNSSVKCDFKDTKHSTVLNIDDEDVILQDEDTQLTFKDDEMIHEPSDEIDKSCKLLNEYVQEDDAQEGSTGNAEDDPYGDNEGAAPNNHNVTDQDSDYHFLLSLLPKMRNLHPNQNMFFRIKVQQSMYDLMTKKSPIPEVAEGEYEEYCTFSETN